MLGGLWEFPGGRREPGETPLECLRRTAGAWMGREVFEATPLAAVRHAYSHFRITLEVFGCRHGERRIDDPPDARWVTVGEMDRLAFDTASRKVTRCRTGHEPGTVRDTIPIRRANRDRVPKPTPSG